DDVSQSPDRPSVLVAVAKLVVAQAALRPQARQHHLTIGRGGIEGIHTAIPKGLARGENEELCEGVGDPPDAPLHTGPQHPGYVAFKVQSVALLGGSQGFFRPVVNGDVSHGVAEPGGPSSSTTRCRGPTAKRHAPLRRSRCRGCASTR